MAETHYFVCQSGKSNKFWEYTLDGCKVTKRYGRIGGHVTEAPKTYYSEYAAKIAIEAEANKKLNPPPGKDQYVEVDREKLEKETEVAELLGTRYKIQRLEYLATQWDESHAMADVDVQFSQYYDPACGVYVEILESWTKEVTYLLLNKKVSMTFRAGHATADGASLSMGWGAGSSFVEGVRKWLRTLRQVVEEVAIQFGAIGARALSIDDDEPAISAPTMASIVKAAAAKSSGTNDQVLSKFAALGARMLDL